MLGFGYWCLLSCDLFSFRLFNPVFFPGGYPPHYCQRNFLHPIAPPADLPIFPSCFLSPLPRGRVCALVAGRRDTRAAVLATIARGAGRRVWRTWRRHSPAASRRRRRRGPDTKHGLRPSGSRRRRWPSLDGGGLDSEGAAAVEWTGSVTGRRRRVVDAADAAAAGLCGRRCHGRTPAPGSAPRGSGQTPQIRGPWGPSLMAVAPAGLRRPSAENSH